MPSATASGMSPGRNSLDQHRFVVAGATFDEFDYRHQLLHGGDNDNSDRDLSAASTVDVDNTHPYLMRYADMYAHDNSMSDASSVSTGGPTFVGVNKRPPSRFKQGQKVLYTSNKGRSDAIVMRVMYDDENQPHYTIKLASGQEEQTESTKLNTNRNMTSIKGGATDENGEAPTKCVNFKTDPTPLFQSLYQGLWHTAQQLLLSNPEQAKVWVGRYAKRTPGSFDEGDVRWLLLPLHLFIALGGRSQEETIAKPEKEEEVVDVPEDETDEFEQMGKANEDARQSPPIRLLTALLSAYPQATQCTDDQNMIPLQSAIRGNVPLPIIEKLLEVDPSSVYRKDGRGRNAFALTEKVFGKHNHKKQVGKEDEAREMRYGKLTLLLADAARRVSSPAKSQPKEKILSQGIVQHKKSQENDAMNKRLQQLQNENLALRKENAELRHRSQINTNLLEQLVDKLQMYEEQRSIDIENYNEIFGSKDELVKRREGILLSISEDDDAQEEKEQTVEEKQVAGKGAYHKRLERYLTSPKANKESFNIISPASTMTEATEPENMASPVSITTGAEEMASPLSPSMMIPSLKSSDEYDDAHDTTGVVEASEEDVSLSNVDKAREDDTGSNIKEPSESDESSTSYTSNADGQDIFRPREDEAQVEVSRPSDATTFVGDIDISKMDCDAVADPEPELPSTSLPKVETDITATSSSEEDNCHEDPVILTALSEEEKNQLDVE